MAHNTTDSIDPALRGRATKDPASRERATKDPASPLRTGWTTGACAAAAAKAAFHALATGRFLDPVSITLPRGQRPAFPLAEAALWSDAAHAAIVKDAGDDPDVTHGALLRAQVAWAAPGAGVRFVAGDGVGRVTLPGLPIPPGEPAINPVPREIIRGALYDVAAAAGCSADVSVTISIPGGEALAAKTWNPRLGVIGGLSILGTTGVVRPFSCAAWIASIHRGVDVARAAGLTHVVGSTGATSEAAAQARYGLPDTAMLDMGDFAGGLLKYLRAHPAPRLTIAGGFGKMTKLAQGALDLHSGRSQVDFSRLAAWAAEVGLDSAPIAAANTARHALEIAGPRLAATVAARALAVVRKTLGAAPIAAEVLIYDRAGGLVASAGGDPV